jgi:5'-methylthioadenosine/S-adenosylhomocysteine nucleosidase
MNEHGRIAVICAMDSEAVQLRRRLDAPREAPLSVWQRTQGQLGAHEVDLIVCGVGLINAAAASAVLCATERPRAIFNYGCAGAHREDLGPGDVIIGEQVAHFSAQIVLPDGERRYMGFLYHVDELRVETEAIPADPELLDLCQRMAARAVLPAWPGVPHMPAIYSGAVASADVWTQHGDSIRTLHDLHGSLCEEMEAAAIAQVAAIYGVPFLAVKDISNNELCKATELPGASGWPSLHDFEDQLGLRAALVVDATIGALP